MTATVAGCLVHGGLQVGPCPICRIDPSADVYRHPTAGRPRILQAVPEIDAPLKREGKPPGSVPCLHRHTVIHVTERRLSCSDCEAWLDPFDHILKLTNDWTWYQQRHAEARNLLGSLEGTVADLRDEEKRLKGRIKRARPQELERCRIAFARTARVFTRVEEALSALGFKTDAVAGPEWDSDRPTTVTHLLWAARHELEKLSRALGVDSETEGEQR